MKTPDQNPVVVVDTSQSLSGLDPVFVALRFPCDQVMSHMWLVPIWVTLKPVTMDITWQSR
jgi:hypothetical protein